jgi:Mg/Co/Ni transporter MgtE
MLTSPNIRKMRTALKPAFARMQTAHRAGLLQQCDDCTAAALLSLLGAREGKSLLGEMRPQLRAQVLDRLPAEWLGAAVADTEAGLIVDTLNELPAASRYLLLSGLPLERCAIPSHLSTELGGMARARTDVARHCRPKRAQDDIYLEGRAALGLPIDFEIVALAIHV